MTSEVIVPQRKLKSGVTVSPEGGCGVNDVVHRPAPACCRCRSCPADLGGHSPTAASPVEATAEWAGRTTKRCGGANTMGPSTCPDDGVLLRLHAWFHLTLRLCAALRDDVSVYTLVSKAFTCILYLSWIHFFTSTLTPLTQTLVRVFSTFMASPSKRLLKPPLTTDFAWFVNVCPLLSVAALQTWQSPSSRSRRHQHARR